MVDITQTARFVSLLTRDTLALILAGGRGSRLQQLTHWRAKPAMPFGGKFRFIDFPLSNCLNSGIRRIGVLTQYKAHSLIQHIQRGWGFLRGEFNEFVELLPAQQRIVEEWYAGTADAVYQNMDIIRNHAPRFVLVLAGDHIYKMDYGPLLAYHVDHDADMTVACSEVPVDTASAFGVMTVDETHRVMRFDEKPDAPTSVPGRADITLASMGIYIFNAEFLYEQLIRDADTSSSSHDFGRDIIPRIIDRYRVMAYPFRDPKTDAQAYWRDVGTIDAYWQANMELIEVQPELDLYDARWPIWTYQEQLPPAKFVFEEPDRCGRAVRSMVSGGCIISGALIRHSLLFSNVRVEPYSVIEDSLLLPDVRVERNCQLRKVIIDKGCRIAEGTVIGENLEEDAKRYHVTPNNVVLVIPEMLGQARHYAR